MIYLFFSFKPVIFSHSWCRLKWLKLYHLRTFIRLRTTPSGDTDIFIPMQLYSPRPRNMLCVKYVEFAFDLKSTLGIYHLHECLCCVFKIKILLCLEDKLWSQNQCLYSFVKECKCRKLAPPCFAWEKTFFIFKLYTLASNTLYILNIWQ